MSEDKKVENEEIQEVQETQEDKKDQASFDTLGLNKSILKAVKDLGFITPSAIQIAAIPVILDGHDVVAQAQTGTGKTAAFGLPCIQKMTDSHDTQLLVVVPTRELSMQVANALKTFVKGQDIDVLSIYGGSSYRDQLGPLRRGVEIVVSTPGRLMDLLKNYKLPKFTPNMVVLDEADEMLDMGFYEDILEIFKYLTDDKQTLLFSATMPNQIKRLAQQILNEPVELAITKSQDQTINKDIKEIYYVISEKERYQAAVRILRFQNPNKTIIFCKTKRDVDQLVTSLVSGQFNAKGLHGDMRQNSRKEVIDSFRASTTNILVATDVAARGLDIDDVSHIINFHLPFDEESYVHRIGRTGRAGRTGTAISFVNLNEFRQIHKLKKKFGSSMTHEFLPTLTEMRQEKVVSMIETIALEHGGSFALSNVQRLAEMCGSMESAAEKLMSYLMKLDKYSGPNTIGVRGPRLEEFFEKLENPRSGGSRDGGGSRSRRRRSGGGGGNRGNGGGDRGNGGGDRNRSSSRKSRDDSYGNSSNTGFKKRKPSSSRRSKN
ncbi:MAG: DEAD/DEAH box helicase [Candidatus Cloacimonadota bacterium]|nr:MAG: DEAD/DEAH box helicase [Candidatus Cloacimonadota bacterium]